MKTLRHKTICWIARGFFSLLFLGLTSNGAAGQTNTFPSSGNVGIGTTSPGTALDVVNSVPAGTGTARFKNTNANTQVIIDSANSNSNMRFDENGTPIWYMGNELSTHRFRFLNSNANGNSELFSMLQNGNVGLGTTTPGERLVTMGNTLSGNITSHTQLYSTYDSQANAIMELGYGTATSNITPIASFVLSKNLTSANNALGVISFANSSIANGLDKRISGIGAWTDGATNSGTLQFYTASAGTFYERLRMTSGGNVGIGTSVPGYKLDVNGEINATGLRINGSPIPTGGSQWSDGSNFIYYTSGNVGIGANSPALQSGTTNKIVEIKGSVNPGLALTSTAAGGRQFFVYSSQANPGYFSVFDATAVADRFVIDGSGRVGIGTASPASNFQIGTQTGGASASPVTLSLGGSFSNSAGSNLKLRLYDDGITANTYGIGVSSGSMDFGVSPSAGYHWYAGGTNKMTLANNGDLSVSGTISAKYQDVAEWVQSSEQLAAGTVVVLDANKSNHVVSSIQAYDTTVAGVISAQPGIALGESAADKVLVATTGRVRVRVDASGGPIRIGDLLVTSDIPGVAMKSDPVNLGGVKFHRPGTIIGKALEPLAKGSGEILVLLSLQ